MPDIPAFFVCRKQFLTGSAISVIGFCSSRFSSICTSFVRRTRCIGTSWSASNGSCCTGIAGVAITRNSCISVVSHIRCTSTSRCSSNVGSGTCISRIVNRRNSCVIGTSGAISSGTCIGICSSSCSLRTVAASYTGICRSSSVTFGSI